MSAKAATKEIDPLVVRPSELEGVPIPEHDGWPVEKTKASLVKTGHGFEESMALSPIHIPVGRRVYVLVPSMVVSHEYDRLTEGSGENKVQLDEFAETHVLEAEGCILLDPDLVADVVAAHNKRIAEHRANVEKAKREARGEFTLPLPDAEPKSNGAAPADG